MSPRWVWASWAVDIAWHYRRLAVGGEGIRKLNTIKAMKKGGDIGELGVRKVGLLARVGWFVDSAGH